jgi:pimeloyl-ACP methyl ester carboxylesterase
MTTSTALIQPQFRTIDGLRIRYADSGGSHGSTARQMTSFIAALGLDEVDLLGFSIGGFVAQEIALVRPTLYPAEVASDVNTFLG